MLTLYNTLA